MYEGKAAQYEKQLKHLEATLAGKLPQELTRKVEELLESYRSENSELMGKVEESNRIVFEL
jgi:predicted RNase H-like nuclease (RuvC/YqgF family)